MKKQKSPLELYTLFLVRVSKMKRTSFKTTTLKRILQPFCNFYFNSENEFRFKIKLSKLGVSCQIKDGYVIVKKQFHVFNFEFHLTTTQNFLEKLIKHSLLKPTLFIDYSNLSNHKY